MVAEVLRIWVRAGGVSLKKRASMAVLACLLVAGLAFADRDDFGNRPEDKDKDDIRATEMVTAGIATAGLIGVAGYFFIRRRSARN